MNASFQTGLLGLFACGLLCTSPWPAGAAPKDAGQDPAARLLREASMMLLKEGNARYVSGKPQHPHLDAERRNSTVAQGQEPFATILACSDSRDPVELIFDRGVGDLFVVRVAGHVAGDSEVATVEYGVSHLHTPVLVVMGHTKCGAVTAAVQGGPFPGKIAALVEKIKPAVAKAKAEGAEGDELIVKAVQANVWQTIEELIKQSSPLREAVHGGRLTILGAIYDLEEGKVSWLGSHPAEEALVALAEQASTDAALAKNLAPGASAARTTPPPSRQPPAVAQQERLADPARGEATPAPLPKQH